MNLSYMTFRPITIDDAELILTWRTKNRISQYMLTDIGTDPNLQRNWIRKSADNPLLCHRILQINNKDTGYVAIKIIDSVQKLGSTGIYIGEEEVDHALTSFNFIPILNQAFFVLKLEKIKNQILSSNRRLIAAQQFNGYKLIDVHPQFITKENQTYDAYIFEQTKNEWEFFSKKYQWAYGFDFNPTET